jgi:DNA-binding MarR family transcriptional regulator
MHAGHWARMTDQLDRRLAIAFSALTAQFKVGADGSAYEGLSLTDTSVVAWIARSVAAGKQPIQQQVADSLDLPKTTMTSVVKRLSARGLVEQGSGSTDARARTLGLTAEGLHLAASLREAQLRASSVILRTLPARDQVRLVELLETVIAQLPHKQQVQKK